MIPKFLEELAEMDVEDVGFVLYYSHQCPHTAKAIPLLQAKAQEIGVDLKIIHLESQKVARYIPCVYTTFALFHNKEFVTHEIITPAKFEKLAKKLK